MIVYGVGILAVCMLTGMFVGDLLGQIIGVEANVGGVGIAMLMLIVLSNLSSKKVQLGELTQHGITFWSAMYIPIVIAMASKQNVVAAVTSGWLAVIAGVGAVVLSFALIPVFTKLAQRSQREAADP
jgi:malonate transporter MadL subunit